MLLSECFVSGCLVKAPCAAACPGVCRGGEGPWGVHRVWAGAGQRAGLHHSKEQPGKPRGVNGQPDTVLTGLNIRLLCPGPVMLHATWVISLAWVMKGQRCRVVSVVEISLMGRCLQFML